MISVAIVTGGKPHLAERFIEKTMALKGATDCARGSNIGTSWHDARSIGNMFCMGANESQLLTDPDESTHGITFEVNILNYAMADLSIELAFTESVAVTTEPDGDRIGEQVVDTQFRAADALTWVAQPWTI